MTWYRTYNVSSAQDRVDKVLGVSVKDLGQLLAASVESSQERIAFDDGQNAVKGFLDDRNALTVTEGDSSALTQGRETRVRQTFERASPFSTLRLQHCWR